MAVHEHPHRSSGFHLPSFRRNRPASASATDGAVRDVAGTTAAAAYAFASLRLLTGFVFLWAFLDKTFGWAVPRAREHRPPAAGRRTGPAP